MKNIRKIFFILGMLVFCINAWSVPIHDEMELIQTIKNLHVDFNYFNDVKEYLGVHCDTLQNKDVIKSTLKNQLALMRLSNGKRYLLSNVLWGMCTAVGIICFGNAVSTQHKDGKEVPLALFGLANLGVASFLFCYEIMPEIVKIVKLEILTESI